MRLWPLSWMDAAAKALAADGVSPAAIPCHDGQFPRALHREGRLVRKRAYCRRAAVVKDLTELQVGRFRSVAGAVAAGFLLPPGDAPHVMDVVHFRVAACRCVVCGLRKRLVDSAFALNSVAMDSSEVHSTRTRSTPTFAMLAAGLRYGMSVWPALWPLSCAMATLTAVSSSSKWLSLLPVAWMWSSPMARTGSGWVLRSLLQHRVVHTHSACDLRLTGMPIGRKNA